MSESHLWVLAQNECKKSLHLTITRGDCYMVATEEEKEKKKKSGNIALVFTLRCVGWVGHRLPAALWTMEQESFCPQNDLILLLFQPAVFQQPSWFRRNWSRQSGVVFSVVVPSARWLRKTEFFLNDWDVILNYNVTPKDGPMWF